MDRERDRVLGMYARKYGENVTIVTGTDFLLTQEKPYTAKSTARLAIGHQNLEMTIVLFCPGDGTGNDEDYKTSNIVTPFGMYIRKTNKALMPRRKNKVTEYMFPIGSALPDCFIIGLISLEGLTIDPRSTNPLTIIRYKEFGHNPLDYASRMKERHADLGLKLEKTVWVNEAGNRIGDPHAIYCNPETSHGTLQMAGFLGIENKDTINFFDRYAK